jgi:hypothetical protein
MNKLITASILFILGAYVIAYSIVEARYLVAYIGIVLMGIGAMYGLMWQCDKNERVK